jgi:hypothetical protein
MESLALSAVEWVDDIFGYDWGSGRRGALMGSLVQTIYDDNSGPRPYFKAWPNQNIAQSQTCSEAEVSLRV